MTKKRSPRTSKTKENNPYLPRPYKITHYVRETPDNFTITVNMKIKHDPGQFVQVSVPGIGECPISLCSDSDQYIKLNIREVGNVTRSLGKLKKGDTLFIRGPYGNGYPMHHFTGNNLVVIGAGCGVAPLRGIIEYIEHHREDFQDVFLLLGYHSQEDIIFKKELEQWEKQYHLTVALSDAPQGQLCYNVDTGHVTDSLHKLHLTNQNKIVFVCGPPRFMKDSIKILEAKGFNDNQIFISAERLMYCALGVCCHCMIRGKFTCIDGPVFRYDEIKMLTND